MESSRSQVQLVASSDYRNLWRLGHFHWIWHALHHGHFLGSDYRRVPVGPKRIRICGGDSEFILGLFSADIWRNRRPVRFGPRDSRRRSVLHRRTRLDAGFYNSARSVYIQWRTHRVWTFGHHVCSGVGRNRTRGSSKTSFHWHWVWDLPLVQWASSFWCPLGSHSCPPTAGLSP